MQNSEKKNARELEWFFQELNNYWDRLYHIALSMMPTPEDAEDMVQESILKAYERMHQFRAESSLYTWLVRILINNCKDRLRKKDLKQASLWWHSREGKLESRQIPDDREDTDKKFELSERSTRLMAALKSIEEDYRELIILHYYDNLSMKDISEILKIPEGTIKSRMSRARELLKDRLNLEEMRPD